MTLIEEALWIVPILLVNCGRQPSVDDAEAALGWGISDCGKGWSGAVQAARAEVYRDLNGQSGGGKDRPVKN